MSTAAGYLLNIPESRRQDLFHAIDIDGRLAEAVPDFEHSRSVPLIGFLCFETGFITHIAEAHRGWRAGTGLRRINFREVVRLDQPVNLNDVSALAKDRLRSLVTSRLQIGGLLPPATFREVVEAVRTIAPQTRPLLDRYSEDRNARIAGLRPAAREALGYQKETVATALAMAGLDRAPLQSWQPPDHGTPRSFLDGLPQVRLREDPMIINDMMQVPGFNYIRTLQYGSALFESEKVRLTVVLANRLPLEKQIGADLIYYNETFKAFVIVQYKAMEREQEAGAIFRLPNAQLADEIRRMDTTLAQLRSCQPSGDALGFRLAENPFLLKLCPRIVFNPDDKGLVPGMYLPLDYWRLLEKDGCTLGPRGGRQITYQTAQRHLDNTAFISLVAGGWIGTNVNQSAVLAPFIRDAVQSGRAITLAVKTATTSDTHDDVEIDDDPLMPLRDV